MFAYYSTYARARYTIILHVAVAKVPAPVSDAQAIATPLRKRAPIKALNDEEALRVTACSNQAHYVGVPQSVPYTHTWSNSSASMHMRSVMTLHGRLGKHRASCNWRLGPEALAHVTAICHASLVQCTITLWSKYIYLQRCDALRVCVERS